MKKSKTRYLVFLKQLTGTHFFKVMRVTVFLILIGISNVFASSTYSQSTKFTFDLRNVSLEQLFEEIQIQSEFNIFYKNNQVDKTRKVDITASKTSVEDILTKALEGMQLDFKVIDRQIVIFPKENLEDIKTKESELEQPQQKTVSGKVTDSSGLPLPGVTVVVKGTTQGTITDADGNYSLADIPEDATLVFSFVGMQTQEISVVGITTINVTLTEETIGLEEVVAIGYGTIRKADLTGSVATISEDDIEKNSYANVLQGLQGKIPGVFITADGNPSGDVGIQIRGLTSLRAAPPLIIIDNLPTTMNLSDINSKDIASIQVLKDAASASIYGSRAASGVIIIETKSGKTGEAKITYNGSFGISSFMNRIDLMNTDQYGQALWQAAINDGVDPDLATQIYDYDWGYEDGKSVLYDVSPVEWLCLDQSQRSADTDWFKEISQLGIQNEHQITVSNGNKKAKSLFSLNYYENQGTQIYSRFRRLTLRLNSEYKLFNNRITIGENISVGNNKYNNQNQSHYALVMPPIIPVYSEDGGWGGTAYALGMDDYNNPVRELTLNKDNFDYSDKLVGSIYALLKIAKRINLKTLYGIDYTAHRYRDILFKWEEAGGKFNDLNQIRTYRSNEITTTWSNTLSYNLEKNKHRLDALLGTEFVLYSYENLQGNRYDTELEDYDYAYLDAATGTSSVSGIGDEWSLLSYFSKLNYAYDNKYLLAVTIRYDGSSKFGENNKFGFFPAVSAGWRISKEPFFEKYAFVQDLKVRASWGMNGNSNIPTNALLDYYDTSLNDTGYAINGNQTGQVESGYRKTHTGNPDLKWEATEQLNVGFDFSLYKGALTGSFDCFLKSTKGMLYELPYIGAIGEGGSQWVNAADMSNKGFELIIAYSGNINKEFTYSITGNISSFKNRIDNLPESARYAYGGNGIDDDILGRPLNSYYGFVTDGLFKSQEELDNSAEQAGKGLGRIRYMDLNGDGEITWDQDRTWIGCSDPDIMYGVTFDAKFRNIDFNMFWQGVAGNVVENTWKSYSDFWAVWTQAGFNHATRLLNAWTPDNHDSDIPALSLQNANDEKRLSTYFIESGAYLKLRHIEIGYSLPQKLVSKIGIQKCRLNFNAQNIVNLKKWWGDNAYTSVDPENASKDSEYSDPYLRPQIFKIGIDVTF